jgi:hypothetical protein
MALLLVITIAFAPGVFLVPLFYWTRWLARRIAAPRFVLRTAYTLVALGTFAALVGAVGGIRALTAVAGGDISESARHLAEGISEAMNGGALVVSVAMILALWLLFGTWRWHWRRRD